MNIAVLIPAHNEQTGLGATLQSVLQQLGPGDRIVVVADNCNDATAQVAREADPRVQVSERHHESLRGKGYALDHGVRLMTAWTLPPAAVVIIDADCVLAPHSLPTLAAEVQRTGHPIQALNLMHAPAGAPLHVRIAEFAWLLKNQVRPTGMRHLGLPCQLMGTGMAFPWQIIADAPLADGHLVEDIKLGTTLASRGQAPLFCDTAAVHSQFPSISANVDSQRRRWEQGHLSLIASQGLGMLLKSIVRRNRDLFFMAADLCVPPLASLVLALSVLLIASVVTGAMHHSVLASLLSGLSLVFVTLAVLLCWHRHGRHLIRAEELLRSPGYALAKLPIYMSALTGKRKTWVRTGRDQE